MTTISVITSNDRKSSYLDYRDYFFFIREELVKKLSSKPGVLIVNLDNQLSIATFIAGLSIRNEFGDYMLDIEIVYPNKNLTHLLSMSEIEHVYDLEKFANSTRIADRKNFNQYSQAKAHKNLIDKCDEVWYITRNSREFRQAMKYTSVHNVANRKIDYETFEIGEIEFIDIMM